LHPERIAEDPQLEARLKPLATIRMESGEILTKYYLQMPLRFPQPVRPNDLLPGDQYRKVFNGTA
jgi:hypothetical protein